MTAAAPTPRDWRDPLAPGRLNEILGNLDDALAAPADGGWGPTTDTTPLPAPRRMTRFVPPPGAVPPGTGAHREPDPDPEPDRHAPHREPLDVAALAARAALGAVAVGVILTLLGFAGIGPGAPAKAHAAERAATAPVSFASASGTMWVGSQAVTVNVTVSGATAGMPHPCVVNNGPDTIAVVNYSISDASHTLTVPDRLLAKGGSYCWARGSVRLPARLYVTAVDQQNGAPGKLTLMIRPTTAPPAPKPAPGPAHNPPAYSITGRTAGIQRAVGVSADGVWGPVTQAAVDRLQAAAYMHYGVDMDVVRRLQAVLGVPMDGLWGPWTNSALFIAKINAHA